MKQRNRFAFVVLLCLTLGACGRSRTGASVTLLDNGDLGILTAADLNPASTNPGASNSERIWCSLSFAGQPQTTVARASSTGHFDLNLGHWNAQIDHTTQLAGQSARAEATGDLVVVRATLSSDQGGDPVRGESRIPVQAAAAAGAASSATVVIPESGARPALRCWPAAADL